MVSSGFCLMEGVGVHWYDYISVSLLCVLLMQRPRLFLCSLQPSAESEICWCLKIFLPFPVAVKGSNNVCAWVWVWYCDIRRNIHLVFIPHCGHKSPSNAYNFLSDTGERSIFCFHNDPLSTTPDLMLMRWCWRMEADGQRTNCVIGGLELSTPQSGSQWGERGWRLS